MNGPATDGENIPADELTAFSLTDVHGYHELARRIAWTVIFVSIVAASCIGIALLMKPTR